MKKDDIEEMFSSLENFSKMPPESLWKGIEEKLDVPKKKKRAAFWWPLAACLVVGLGLLGTFYFHSSPKDSLLQLPVQPENGVVHQSRSIADSVIESKAIQEHDQEQILSKPSIHNSVVHSSLSSKREKEKKAATTQLVFHSNGNSVLKKDAFVSEKGGNNSKTLAENKPSSILQSNASLFQNNKIVATTAKIEKDVIVQDSKATEKTSTTHVEENALATLVKEMEEKKEKKSEIQDKWSLQVFAGVNSSQNLKNQKTLGSTIESQRGHSYGVKTNYKLNRRWAVSTGLKVSELGQQVADVSYVNSAQSLVNISKQPLSVPTSKDKGAIASNANYLFIPHASEQSKQGVNNAFYQTGNLSQKVQYLEMPMEISYALLNKGKARINMNTGGFVGKVIGNEIKLDNNSIGQNQDVNEVVFGTLLSSTLQYEVLKKTRVFVEPGMNYYTQPTQNQNFNQFQLIFNFGLNVSF